MQAVVEKKNSKVSGKKIFLYTLGLGLGGVAIYFTIDHFRKKGTSSGGDIPNMTPTKTSSSSGWIEGTFPLSKDLSRKKNKVFNLQQAIIAKGGVAAQEIKSTGGADGIFGPGLEKALTALGYSTVVDATTYNAIVSKSPAVVNGIDAMAVAKEIYYSADPEMLYLKNLDKAIEALRQIKNVSDYNLVNAKHKEFSEDISGTTRTIVTHLLLGFASQAEKDKLGNEFKRIGLIYNGSQWSIPTISGLFGLLPDGIREVITIEPTSIRNESGTSIQVQKNIILGAEIEKDSNGITKILTIDNKIIFAPSTLLKYV